MGGTLPAGLSPYRFFAHYLRGAWQDFPIDCAHGDPGYWHRGRRDVELPVLHRQTLSEQ